MSQELSSHFVRIKRVDAAKQIVFGEVYAPNVLDTYGEMMTAEGIEEMAYRYMQLGNLTGTIDTMHDETSNGSYPVESFIARKGDPDYTPGAWVLGVKVVGDAWDKVQKGELNGFSFQAMVRKLTAVVEVEIMTENVGFTEMAAGHEHSYYVELDENGVVKGGRTSIVNGHFHEITAGTATEISAGHAHRLFIGG